MAGLSLAIVFFLLNLKYFLKCFAVLLHIFRCKKSRSAEILNAFQGDIRSCSGKDSGKTATYFMMSELNVYAFSQLVQWKVSLVSSISMCVS